MSQINRETSIPLYKIKQKLKEFNIERIYKNKKWLSHQFLDLNKMPSQIALEYHRKITPETIRKWIKKHEISSDNRFKNGRIIRKYQNEEWLEHQYLDLKKTPKQIASEVKVYKSIIMKWLIKNNIKIREEDIKKENNSLEEPPLSRIVNGYSLLILE